MNGWYMKLFIHTYVEEKKLKHIMSWSK